MDLESFLPSIGGIHIDIVSKKKVHFNVRVSFHSVGNSVVFTSKATAKVPFVLVLQRDGNSTEVHSELQLINWSCPAIKPFRKLLHRPRFFFPLFVSAKNTCLYCELNGVSSRRGINKNGDIDKKKKKEEEQEEDEEKRKRM